MVGTNSSPSCPGCSTRGVFPKRVDVSRSLWIYRKKNRCPDVGEYGKMLKHKAKPIGHI